MAFIDDTREGRSSMLDGGVLPKRSPREGGCAPEVCMLKYVLRPAVPFNVTSWPLCSWRHKSIKVAVLGECTFEAVCVFCVSE